MRKIERFESRAITYHRRERYRSASVVIHGDEVDEEGGSAYHEWQHESAEDHLFDPHAPAHSRVKSAACVTVYGRRGGIHEYRS